MTSRDFPAAIVSLGPLHCQVPVFHPEHAANPVRVDGWRGVQASEAVEILERLERSGFVVIEAGEAPDLAAPRFLAASLGLGPIFNPPIFRSRSYVDSHGVTTVGTGDIADGHPAFHRTSGQALHVDGTLERIGEIKYAMPLCVAPAAEGGVSQIFNATGAFGELLGEDSPAAATLTAAEVLVRTSGLAQIEGRRGIGPAFAVSEDRIISRYSVTGTDEFDRAAVRDPAALVRALEFLADAAKPGSPYYCEVALAAGQGLLLANDRVSHGRSSYADGPALRRRMLRALFATRRAVRVSSRCPRP